MTYSGETSFRDPTVAQVIRLVERYLSSPDNRDVDSVADIISDYVTPLTPDGTSIPRERWDEFGIALTLDIDEEHAHNAGFSVFFSDHQRENDERTADSYQAVFDALCSRFGSPEQQTSGQQPDAYWQVGGDGIELYCHMTGSSVVQLGLGQAVDFTPTSGAILTGP